jgi:vitamin B12 transporter
MQKKLSTSLVASFLLATNLFSAQNLDTITVTSATKSTQSIKDVTSNIEVITKDEIQERHFTTVSEALNTLAGIDVVSNGGLGNTTSVFIRGFDNQRVLVLIDGINYNDHTGISGARLEHLMINDIEQIEVIKGAQSGIWGADANAGVINIITSAAKEGSHINSSVEIGSYNTKKMKASVSHKNKIFDVKLSAARVLSDGFTSQAPRGRDIDDFEKDGYENTTLNLKTGLNINDKNRVELTHTIINAKTEYDATVYNPDFSKNLVASANSTGHELETKNSYSSLNYLNTNEYSTVKLYGNYSIINRDDPTGYTTNFDGKVKEFGLSTQVPYLNNSSFVQLGTSYKVSTHENDVNKELRNKAVFITNSTKYDNAIFTQSLRYDKYDLFDNKLTGKIGLKYNITSELYVGSNYGTAYNVPVFYKLYNTYAGNINLQPETTKSADFTIGYKTLSLTYFNNKIENMIDYDYSTSTYNNLDGTTKLKGYEISYKNDLTQNALLSLNYTQLSAKDNTGEKLVRRADRKLNFGVDYYGIDKLHLNLNGQYIGSRKDISGVQTGKYTIFNTVLNYEINKNFSTYLKVDNLFNKYYQVVDGYATPERSGYIGLKATF